MWGVKKNTCFFWGMLTACFCCHGWHHQLLPWKIGQISGSSLVIQRIDKHFKWGGMFAWKGFYLLPGWHVCWVRFRIQHEIWWFPDLTSTYELLMNSYRPPSPCDFRSMSFLPRDTTRETSGTPALASHVLWGLPKVQTTMLEELIETWIDSGALCKLVELCKPVPCGKSGWKMPPSIEVELSTVVIACHCPTWNYVCFVSYVRMVFVMLYIYIDSSFWLFQLF